MNLQELLAQPLQERDAIVARLVDDREIARDDVRAVAAAKAIRHRTPAMKAVTVVVDLVEDRDDNCSGAMAMCLTDVYRVTVSASSTAGDWSSRRIEAVIPMIVSVSPYGEIGIECDRDRESECVLRSTGCMGDDEMIDLPTFGSWLQHAAGKSLLREWLMWHGVSELVANQPVR